MNKEEELYKKVTLSNFKCYNGHPRSCDGCPYEYLSGHGCKNAQWQDAIQLIGAQHSIIKHLEEKE